MRDAVITPLVELPAFNAETDTSLVIEAAYGLRTKDAAEEILPAVKALRSGVTSVTIEETLAAAVADGRILIEETRVGPNRSRAKIYARPASEATNG